MNIVMVTNTFTPHVGGVARSVETFSAEYRRRGHRVLTIAPQFDGTPEDETDVVRIPAIQRFNGSDFSLRIPVPGLVSRVLADFQPDVVHSHHPFLLGGTALRMAAAANVPLVFTHHTLYEQYTHYVPGDSPVLQRFVIDLATGYANLCDQVFAPSHSIAELLRERGVETPIAVIPTGVDRERFGNGDGAAARARFGIPAGALVVGHVGRLAPEKNLQFLAGAVCRFLQTHPDAWFLLVGTGPSEAEIEREAKRTGVSGRLHRTGCLEGQALIDAYHAMDVFAFASQSETQGMVLTEAMAAGVPVVAVDASGVRDVVIDGRNGRLLPRLDDQAFVAALADFAASSPARREALGRGALATAEQFSLSRCAERALQVYRRLIGRKRADRDDEESPWATAQRRIEAEWDLWASRAHAVGAALVERRAPAEGTLAARTA